MLSSRCVIVMTASLCCFAATMRAQAMREDGDFGQQVAPILEQHCIRCHTPGNTKGDLSLATADNLRENEYIVPGRPDESYLLEVVTSDGSDRPAMPQEGPPLTAEQVDILRKWIAEGAEWPADVIIRPRSRADTSWWSLQPLDGGQHQSIDDFIKARLAEEGLTFGPQADRRTLIRRATYDLLGLPPRPEDVEAFVNDPDPRAWEKLIDRLLDSPHYGERWGRHWLDVVRFGESNGFERNVIIDTLWPFRDYVIRSLNEDKPFDQFIREHLAGDVDQQDPNVIVGTAFLVAGPYDDVGNQDAAQAAQIRANTLDEIISATGQAFLGMTVGCARCHDHKFDPITQEDYYALYATFSGVRHGAVPVARPEDRRARTEALEPLNKRKAALERSRQQLRDGILKRAAAKLADYQDDWMRPPVDRTGTEERFAPVSAKFIRLVCEAQDGNPASSSGFRIDEFEAWSAGTDPRNVALASNGATASGRARQIEDFPDAYGPQLAIDGKTGARFLATGRDLTIEFAEVTTVDRVVFSSARGEETPEHGKFVFVAEYRLEVSPDGKSWQEVAHGRDRQPPGSRIIRTSPGGTLTPLEHRILKLETTADERQEEGRLKRELANVNRQLAAIPPLPSVWIGRRVASDAAGPFRVFLGGNPATPGETIAPASPSFLEKTARTYKLDARIGEAERRRALADWITDNSNPLPARVLANRVWHYHFGTGIVDTPNDLGYMGGRPSHPRLLDYLARRLIDGGWRLKPLHREIMTSATYQQSSAFRPEAAARDHSARWLWRYPPRRLSAEEIRDTILQIAGRFTPLAPRDSAAGGVDGSSLVPDGGPGFRLYHFMQDNVCTYAPLDKHGPETYRRAVYHQNARASVVDLMSDFDQPDCAFSAPGRAQTTSPLQALTMLNHSFTTDMAEFFAARLRNDAGDDAGARIRHAWELCYGRKPTARELQDCSRFIDEHGLASLCRVLLNTSEMIYVR